MVSETLVVEVDEVEDDVWALTPAETSPQTEVINLILKNGINELLESDKAIKAA